MSDNKRNTAFQTSSRSRKRVARQRPWLAVPLAVLVLLLCVALFFVVKHAVAKWGSGSSDPSVATTTTVREESSGVPEESSGSPEESAAATGERADNQTESTPAAAESSTASLSPGAESFHLYTAEELLPVPEDISRGFFEDVNAEDKTGSWWFGSMKRNLESGAVEKVYDRSAATLALLDKYGAIYRKNADQKVCYLTFDCGYEFGHTASILDTLRDKGVKAVFFVAGDFVNDNANKDLLMRMYAEGHIIGSHTDHHPVMPTLSDDKFIEELNNLQIKVNNMLGQSVQIRFYRPPQGSCSERDLYLARKMGITTVFWSYAYGDYDTQNQMEVSQALEKAKVGLHDGCVYLLHAVSSTNAAMLGDLIDFIRSEGYDIRRIDQ